MKTSKNVTLKFALLLAIALGAIVGTVAVTQHRANSANVAAEPAGD